MSSIVVVLCALVEASPDILYATLAAAGAAAIVTAFAAIRWALR